MTKPNYKLVARERTCNKICPYYETFSHCVTGGCTLSNLIVADGWPCIPGIREQIDELKEENEQLKEELVRLKPSEVCTNCNGAGSLSQYDFYNGVHEEECPACNGVTPKFVEDKSLGIPPDTNDEGF